MTHSLITSDTKNQSLNDINLDTILQLSGLAGGRCWSPDDNRKLVPFRYHWSGRGAWGRLFVQHSSHFDLRKIQRRNYQNQNTHTNTISTEAVLNYI